MPAAKPQGAPSGASTKSYAIRLVDRIRAGHIAQHGATYLDPAHWAASEAELQRYLPTIPCIVADNIDEFEYWHWREPKLAAKGKLEARDVPNLVPPFHSFWVEWRWFDPAIRAIGMRLSGCLVECCEFGGEIETRKPGEKFGFSAMPFVEREGSIYHSVWRAMASSDAQGDLVDCWIEQSPFVKGAILDPAMEQSDKGLALAHLTNVLIGVSFLNCRNVHLYDVPAAPRGLRLAHHRKTGQWLARLKQIEITPMTKIAREVGGEEGYSGVHPMFHIMRGHFKRYDEGKGLFGKHHGTFFWHQTTRGTMEHGEVKSRYSIRLDGKKGQR